MAEKLVKNVDGDVWRQFAGFCKVKDVLVGVEISDILKKYLNEKVR